MHNVSYDTDLDRNIRIRNQMQLRMRQLTTNSDEYQRFKAELDQVDILIKGMTKYKPFYAELGDSVFFNWFRKWSQQGRLEKTIEATGYNSLYDKALQIKFA